MSGHIFLLIGPSGSGKTTLIKEVSRTLPNVEFIPTTTTRPPRPSEVNGKDYFFVSDEEFDRLVQEDKFFEWQQIHGNRYGTPKSRLLEKLAVNGVGIMSVDIVGGLKIRRALPDTSTAIFIRPSSIEDLVERLHSRPGSIKQDTVTRLQRAKEELALGDQCDFTVINDNGHLITAVSQLLQIIRQQNRSATLT